MDTSSIRKALSQIESQHEQYGLGVTSWLISLVRALCTELDETRKRKPHKLPDERPGVTHKFNIGTHFEGYMNVGLYEDGQPGELFITVSDAKLEDSALAHTMHSLLDVIAIMTSAALQHGVPLEALVRKFSFVRFEPAGFTNNKAVPIAHSIIDYVFRWLEARFIKEDSDVTVPGQGSSSS